MCRMNVWKFVGICGRLTDLEVVLMSGVICCLNYDDQHDKHMSEYIEDNQDD